MFCECLYKISVLTNLNGEWYYVNLICCENPSKSPFSHKFLMSNILDFTDFEKGTNLVVCFKEH